MEILFFEFWRACVAGLFMDWRWLAICCSVPPTLMMVLMCFMPETPRFLLSQGKRREAEEALRFLRGPDAPVEWECARMEDASDSQVRWWLITSRGKACSWLRLMGCAPSPQGTSFHISDLKDPGVYKPLIIGVMLMVFQQMTGINAIMFYAENIFEQAHFEVTDLCRRLGWRFGKCLVTVRLFKI